MGIEPDYKSTDFGPMPAEWAISTFGVIADIIDPQPDHRTPPEEVGGEPYIGISDFVDDNQIDWDGCRKIISKAVDKQQASFQISSGDIIFGKIGTIGEPKFLPQTPFRYALSANIILIKPKIEPHFVMAWLKSSIAHKLINQELHSTSQAAFGINKLRCLPIPVPPLDEQRAIASALSDVDSLLTSLDQLITKKRYLKQATIQQLLTGQTRLTGFKTEWENLSLGKLATFHKGKGLPKSALNPYGAEACIHYGELFTQYSEIIDSPSSRTDYAPDHFRSVANDVLMPTSDVTPRGLAKASCITMSGVVLGGDILVIRTDPNRVFGSFLSYLIRHEEEQVLRLVTGTTVFHLYGTDMSKFILCLPPLNEQKAIIEVLADMSSEISALEIRREKTLCLKQAMMQELLTGKTRLIKKEKSDV